MPIPSFKFLSLIGSITLCCFLFTGRCRAQQFPPLARQNFSQVAPQGFGQRQNSWAWSMEWFKGKLYVGTDRAYECAFQAAVNVILPGSYPPADPDVQCTADPTDLPLRAEIWVWSPDTRAWTRVFQSPQDVPIPGTNKFTARDIGFRGMTVFQEPDGTQALYVGGCSAKALYGIQAPGRLLRTVDGVNFTPVPQDPGTFFGDRPGMCLRGIEEYNGKMYIVSTNFKGEGVLLESANPALGNDSFRQVSPDNVRVYEIATFNGFLYATFDSPQGFGLYKTNASGPLPYIYTPIILNGGYLQQGGNPIALSMKVFNGDLYVGSDSVRTISSVFCALQAFCVSSIFGNGGAELFRVHPDDTWDIVVGLPRATQQGAKTPLSGYRSGFSWPLNQHLWRMEVFDGRLYVGTYDVSTELRNAPNGLGAALAPEFGFDLWYTTDGVHFTAVDVTGFEDPFNYGVRSLQATPYGLFLGTANPFYGLRIYLGVPSATP